MWMLFSSGDRSSYSLDDSYRHKGSSIRDPVFKAFRICGVSHVHSYEVTAIGPGIGVLAMSGSHFWLVLFPNWSVKVLTKTITSGKTAYVEADLSKSPNSTILALMAFAHWIISDILLKFGLALIKATCWASSRIRKP